MVELKKEWTNREIIEKNNGLWELARLLIEDKQLRWDVSGNLKKAMDIARQVEDMKAEMNPATKEKEIRELLRVMNTVEFKPLNRFALEKVAGYTAAIEVQIFDLITE